MSSRRIALVGERSESVLAHRAIPAALELCKPLISRELAWEWVPTSEIIRGADRLRQFDGVWLVPGSPYNNTEGALEAARWAREEAKPFFGTCGGFQHGVLEIARSLAGIERASHEETDPGAEELVIRRLSCSLVGTVGSLRFTSGSRMAIAYGALQAAEGYHCSFGLNPEFRSCLEQSGLTFTAFDENGEIRGAELRGHPFHVGTLFQPERAALTGVLPPLVHAFAAAVHGFR